MAPRPCGGTEVIILVGAYKAERIPNDAAVIRLVSPMNGAMVEKGSEAEVEIEFDSFELGQDERITGTYTFYRGVIMTQRDATEDENVIPVKRGIFYWQRCTGHN